MKLYKKLTAVVSSAALLLALTACGESKTPISEPELSTSVSSVVPSVGSEVKIPKEPFTEFKMLPAHVREDGVQTYMVEVPGQTESLRLATTLDKSRVAKEAKDAGLSMDDIFEIYSFDIKDLISNYKETLSQGHIFNLYQTETGDMYVGADRTELFAISLNKDSTAEGGIMYLLLSGMEAPVEVQEEMYEKVGKAIDYVEGKKDELKSMITESTPTVYIGGESEYDRYPYIEETKEQLMPIMIASFKNPSGAISLMLKDAPVEEIQFAINNPEESSVIEYTDSALFYDTFGLKMTSSPMEYTIHYGGRDIIVTPQNARGFIEAMIPYQGAMGHILVLTDLENNLEIYEHHMAVVNGVIEPTGTNGDKIKQFSSL